MARASRTRRRHTPLRRDFASALDDVEVGRLAVAKVCELVGLRARRASFAVTAAIAGEHDVVQRSHRLFDFIAAQQLSYELPRRHLAGAASSDSPA